MKNDNRPIGVFDSGLGGLTVVKSIIKNMPDENIIYFGDTAHVPYGTRTKEQIVQYVMNDVRFLNLFDIKAIVIACNTADAVAREFVEAKYPLPVFGVVGPAAKAAALATENGKIGIIATNATVASGAYEREIKKYKAAAEVFSEACPLLVPLVEDGRFHKGDVVLEGALSEYLDYMKKRDVDTLVLGCTHYPLLYDIVADMMPDVKIISSSDAAAQSLYSMFETNKMFNTDEKEKGGRRYFVSDGAGEFEKNAKIFMGGELGGEVRQADPE